MDDTSVTIETVERFNAALNAHDVDAAMALMTDDCVFENTWPPPDGERLVGQAAVRAFWERLLASAADVHFETEEMFAAGSRAAVRWRYTWTEQDGQQRHVRGVDLFTVRDGNVAEKLSYVKG